MTTTILRRRAPALTAALLSAALVLTACGSDDSGDKTATSASRQFKADNGTIEIPTQPQRIVTIGSSGLFLDLGIEPAGMAPRADNGTDSGLAWLAPEAAKANEAAANLGTGAAEFDYEKAASLKPDLIVVHIPKKPWESGALDTKRLQSIAPTIWIEITLQKWKAQSERIADAVGELDAFDKDKAGYDALTTEIKDKYGKLLDSTTFTFLNRWDAGFTDAEGTFTLEYPVGYCTSYAEDAGLNILPDTTEELGQELSMERLSSVTKDADVIVYPLGPDGKAKTEFSPIREANIWKSLPQVTTSRALGVQCNTILTYSNKVVSLESLKKALGTLPEAR